ncbi:hypothetical protein [Undibacterium sp. TC9W]|uniref:hypothetical protein n=1 Tax=Undibacterium sp. TC9W TaxID=3413053 RepID=UPI003BF39A4E
MKKYIAFAALISIAFSGLSGCRKNSQSTAENNPDIYCKPAFKEIGPVIEYPNVADLSGPKKKIYSFDEFKTAAGFSMRIPTLVGGLGKPNTNCEMQTGTFFFHWHNGKLVRTVDLVTGDRLYEGLKVDFFADFAMPEEASYKKSEIPKWKMTGSFVLPGHENILFLPFGGYAAESHLPKNLNDRAKWDPMFLFQDARSFNGSSTKFMCYDIQVTEKDQLLYVDVPYVNGATRCMGWISFYPGAGGRLDIYGRNLLENIPLITNAFVKELNTYIVKQ